MKKLLVFIFLITSYTQAQYTIKGTMNPPSKNDWVILYKIEGTKQIFVKNTTIKIDSVTNDNKKQAIGSFQFTLPKDTKPGFYRTSYKLKDDGYVDFVFNNENISFSFNPTSKQAVVFSKSKTNNLYSSYQTEITKAQIDLDSIQISAFQNPSITIKEDYTKAYNKLNSIQEKYLIAAKGNYIEPFIKATLRDNSSSIILSLDDYVSKIPSIFFNKIDFSNDAFSNSSFLINKISKYIFFLNFQDYKTQQALYKSSINKLFSRINNALLKRDYLEFLVKKFEEFGNLEIIDFLFEKHYNNLPDTVKNKKFIQEKIALLAAEVGRIAPDFSWKENGKTLKLSKLKSADNYILVFWSTGCSHCLREIPQLYTFMKENTKTKVIAFALEEESFAWESYKTNFYEWHHVLGLNKWDNKIARTYNIFSTPSYFILDKNKKIIAKPRELKDVKAFFSKK